MKEMKIKIFTIPIVICLTFAASSCVTTKPTIDDLAMQLAEIRIQAMLQSEAMLTDKEFHGYRDILEQRVRDNSALMTTFAKINKNYFSESEMRQLIYIYNNPVVKKWQRHKMDIFLEFREYCKNDVRNLKENKLGQPSPQPYR
ncbi:MAG: hypothetical protein A2283_01680 [Lentisphaerae bacterium RIFOXYA12_FULL_48_11]|nr:MAG: hypothetical protein A2283_01680 [Lentisphaerae bacterium RIFOXYA12_FULL_48_11]